VIVGAEAFSSTEITAQSTRESSTGLLSVYADVDPSVDQTSVRFEMSEFGAAYGERPLHGVSPW
jgi:hypothetical protein